jgi:penicillin-binding protein 2
VGYRLATKNGEYVDSTGMATIRKYAEMFGLGDKSGIEIEEISPNISDRDAVLSAIGQGTHSYTATQLSKYVTTVANSGTCYNLSLVDRTMDYTGNTVNEHEKSVYSTISLDPSLWNTVHTGMRLVVTDDLQTNTFLNNLSVQVAGKTGTAQEGVNNPAHALFISYAPYDNPEVSVTTVIQNGYNSANAAEVTGFVYAYMYDKQALAHATISGNNQVSD